MFIGLRSQECGHGPSLFESIHECLIILLALVVVESVIPSHEGHPYLMFNGWNIRMNASWCDCTVCRNVVTCLCRVQPVLELYMVATLQSLLELYMWIEDGVAFYPYVNKQCIGCMAENAKV